MSTPIEVVIQDLSPDAKLDLFEIDLSPVTGTDTPDDHLYFHAGTNSLRQQVVWQGKTYTNTPIDATGFDLTTKGTMPKPKLVISNIYSAVTAVIESDQVGGDITGAKVIRRQTYARYLDAVNFPARTNNLSYSEAQENWGFNMTSVVYDPSVLDVRGSPTVRRLETTVASGAHNIFNLGNKSLVVGQPITTWAELRAGTRSTARISFYGASGVTGYVTVDLSKGTVLAALGTVDHGIEPIDENGWFRVWITSTVITAGGAGARIWITNGLNTSFPGTGAENIYLGRVHMGVGMIAVQKYQYVGATFSQNPEADPTRYLPDEIFYIERKVSEDPIAVEFELSSALDLSTSKLPKRVVSVGVCTWEQYRGEGCEYTGTYYFDARDNPVTDPAKDICSRSANGCKIRHQAQFGPKALLPFGGFPGARAYKG